MHNLTRLVYSLLALFVGVLLTSGLLGILWQPVHASPGVLYAASASSGSGDCSDWDNACSLQTALASALPGDQVWVKAGVHKPGAARTDSFALPGGVEVYGGFAGSELQLDERDWLANPTVLSGDIDGNDITAPDGVVTDSARIAGENSYHVVTASAGLTESARLDGFTITAGQANGAAPHNLGGGIYNLAGDPTIANTILSGNLAGSKGGGMYNEGIYGNESNPSLLQVDFTANSAGSGGGLASFYFSNPSLDNVNFYRNSASSDGGGMYNQQDVRPGLTDCLFSANTAAAGGGIYNDIWSYPNLKRVIFDGNTANSAGGGMASFNSAHPTLDEVTFIHNSAGNGGGMWSYYNAGALLINNTRFIENSAAKGGGLYSQADPYSDRPVINTIFLENSASNSGGALYSDDSRIILTNATVSENSAGVQAGAFYNDNASGAAMQNVILWENSAPTDPEIYNGSSSNTIRYSLVQGSGGSGAGWNASLGTDGGGNLDSDPNFENAAGGDLHLQPGSPAIDAGDNSAVPAEISADLEGNPRFVDVPSTPDTGLGAPPIVDMGAYEFAFASLSLSKTVAPSILEPGETITFSLSIANVSLLPPTQVVLTDTLEGLVSQVSITSSGLAITATGFTPAFVWSVEDISPGHGGIITITGMLIHPLAASVYTNTAAVSFASGGEEFGVTSGVTFTVANAAPAFTSSAVTAAYQGIPYSYAIAAEDWNGDAITITASILPAWLGLVDHGHGTATLSGTPERGDAGQYNITQTVTDAAGLTAEQNFSLLVWARTFFPLALR